MKPDEIVLVEDGPLGDELIRVIIDWKSLLRERLVLLRNDCNLGLTKSLNKGLSVVKSERTSGGIGAWRCFARV